MMAKAINLIAKHVIKNQFQCFLRDFFSHFLYQAMAAAAASTPNDQKWNRSVRNERGTHLKDFPSRCCSSRQM